MQEDTRPAEQQAHAEVADNMREPDSSFVKVRCQDCRNEQVIFNKAARTIHCLVCDEVLAHPTGGKTDVNAQVLELLA